jgi:hypothetical protein
MAANSALRVAANWVFIGFVLEASKINYLVNSKQH